MIPENPSNPISLGRRSFFKGRVPTSENLPIRPPWTLPEPRFLETCTSCDKCVHTCAEGILTRGAGGYPQVDFQNGACTFCGDCARVCEPSAISKQDENTNSPWALEARIGASCLSANAITCRVCGERCDARAIRFQLAVGGVAHPIIDQTACTGCGACVAPCPVGAVEVVQVQMEEQL